MSKVNFLSLPIIAPVRRRAGAPRAHADRRRARARALSVCSLTRSLACLAHARTADVVDRDDDTNRLPPAGARVTARAAPQSASRHLARLWRLRRDFHVEHRRLSRAARASGGARISAGGGGGARRSFVRLARRAQPDARRCRQSSAAAAETASAPARGTIRRRRACGGVARRRTRTSACQRQAAARAMRHNSRQRPEAHVSRRALRCGARSQGQSGFVVKS